MTEKVEEKKELKEKPTPKSAWSAEEKKLIGSYGCQLIYENATQEQLFHKKVPTDAMIITYKSEGKDHKDLVRGPRVNIFDLYFDKFGKGSIQKIDYGHGTISPSQWGYKPPEKRKRRKG
tara:strand:+ start:1697 stop:2056 length:360 start_codon:yes stop_codon:yes gene_type:complete